MGRLSTEWVKTPLAERNRDADTSSIEKVASGKINQLGDGDEVIDIDGVVTGDLAKMSIDAASTTREAS